MIFIPLLHYFHCKNTYSGNEEGMRYRLTPGKCKVTGEDGAEQERSTLTVDVWPDPWTLEFTDPALRRQAVFALSDEGRAQAADYLSQLYEDEIDRWKACPSLLDCDPWTPPQPAEDEGES